MNYGPLEFAAYLRRKAARKQESPAVTAARSAAPVPHPTQNRLTIISGPSTLLRVARNAQVEAVSVYEALASSARRGNGPVRVIVRPTLRPIVLVLSSHQTVEWLIELKSDAILAAVLLAGFGNSSVAGAGDAHITAIGGFYAFKRGSAEFGHLEQEVMRCTGRAIENFRSVYSADEFEIGVD
jgi:hypothetical protein